MSYKRTPRFLSLQALLRAEMLAMVLARLMLLAHVDGNILPPSLPFAVGGTSDTRLLWQRLVSSYAQNRRNHLTVGFYGFATFMRFIIHFRPLMFSYNLPDLPSDAGVTLSLSDISDIFTGKLQYWSDIRIRQRNPGTVPLLYDSVFYLPFIRQPIHLILRDDNCSENIALTKFLSNVSGIWQLQYGLMSSMQNFKSPSGLSVYHTILSSGVFSLVNSVPYSIAYFRGSAPSIPTVSLQLNNGITIGASGVKCTEKEFQNDSVNASDANYPLAYTFYVAFKKNLLISPYNTSVVDKDPLERFSIACRLQIELYRFLLWLTSSESARELLYFHGFCQIRGKNISQSLNEMSCRNKQNCTVSAEELATKDVYSRSRIWEHIVNSKDEYRDLIFTLSTTFAILLVVSIFLFIYLRSHYHPLSEYIISIELMNQSSNSDATQTSPRDFQLKNAAFLEYAFGNNPDCGVLKSLCASKNYRKGIINTWIYADSILSTAPVSRQYKGVDVLLIPTNIRSTSKLMEKRRLNLKHYINVDHENVQRFYGLAKPSTAKNKMQRNICTSKLKENREKQQGGCAIAQGYSESDFILPWIFYIIVEPCVRGSLFELLHSGQYEISQSIKLNLASDIASGMAYLHGKKLIHGRLSSLTCLLNSRWIIKIACWENVENLVQPEFFPGKHSINRGISRCNLKICWQPEHLRLVWRSPAQLKCFIVAQESSRAVNHTILRQDTMETERSRVVEPVGTGVEAGTEREHASTACDVYSFGVILTEIWNLEVPFQDALNVYQHEYQLAEAICNKVYKPTISPNMPSKIREVTELCIDHLETQRPSFRNILKTLASLVPKGRSVAHHMIRAAVTRVNDLDANCTLREKEVTKRKARLCRKLDSLFPRDYSLELVSGSLTPTPSATPQDVLIAVISLDQTFLQSAALADEKIVMRELQCLKQIVEKHANDPLLRCLAAPGGFENDGVCLVSVAHNEVNSPGPTDAQLVIHFLRVICQVERDFVAASAFQPASHPKFCAVLHRARIVFGPLGVYLPCQFVYGGALEDVFELKRYAKAMDVLVTSKVTPKIKHILKEFKDYTLRETYKVQLWVSKKEQINLKLWLTARAPRRGLY
ncbi:unnamed protein product [Hydatigera taeniaeformis]|uniref:Protein kinase domain-containing protein n=1 Tax=Hydatigena taeniaeformis TaxID=6205 RepID=A0A0R3WZE6_HYDTA|nr:unnamed protein product [Hydatigera taeniaeformis]